MMIRICSLASAMYNIVLYTKFVFKFVYMKSSSQFETSSQYFGYSLPPFTSTSHVLCGFQNVVDTNAHVK